MARILVVDDEPAIRELVREVLLTQNWTVDVAADGRQALEALRKSHCDLLIIDRNMPSMTGLEAIAAIRADPKLSSLKIVLLTGAGMPSEIDEALKAGADDCLMKPLGLKDIIDKAAKALGSAA